MHKIYVESLFFAMGMFFLGILSFVFIYLLAKGKLNKFFPSSSQTGFRYSYHYFAKQHYITIFNIDILPVDHSSTALMTASERGDVDKVKRLIESTPVSEMEVDINVANIYYYTALMLASKEGHTEIVKLLIDTSVRRASGADINIANIYDYGDTALMYAAMNGHTETVKLLIDTSVRRASGADINATDNDGWTALMLASLHGYTEIVKLLIDTSVTSRYACWKQQQGWCRASGADTSSIAMPSARRKRGTQTRQTYVNAKSDYGDTALMWASRYGHTDIVEVLIKAGALVNIKDDEGKTALSVATEEGHTDIVELLKASGATE